MPSSDDGDLGTPCTEASLLTPLGYQTGDCGYCKAEDSSASYYARSKALCPLHYQELMDRGWRRSGTLFYLPDAIRSCCPHYTIRLPATQFQPSRDQRQALNRWNRFVLGEKYEKEVAKKYPKTKEEKKRANTSFDLTSAVHESEQPHAKADIPTAHNFQINLEPDTFTEEKYLLFENYQRHVHHEKDGDISQAGFRRFLCSSPLHRHTVTGGKNLGSFHQCYRLDGRLIAMAVLDLLPHAISGVYFIYHSDYEKWSLGKLSALRETALALEAGHEFYYMGYYIHGCKKMRYKGDYKPQYVLDYYTLEWDLLNDDMRALMDRTKYASMSKERARNAGRAVAISSKDNGTTNHQTSLANTGDSTTTEDPLSAPETHSSPRPLQTDDTENEDGDPDSLETVPLPTPSEASSSGLSLLTLTMPGVMSLPQLLSTIDLDSMRVSLGRAGVHRMRDLVSWHGGSETEPSSIKGIMAEMAAAVGAKVAGEVLVDLAQ